eukprot:gene13403-4268_t
MGYLVSKPLKNFKKLYGKDGYITQHKASQFDILNMERKKEFLLRTATVENPKDALSLMYGESGEIISRIRAVLQSIMKLTMLFGQRNISFRGHRDDGEVLSKPNYNDRNFRVFVRHAVEAGDEQLRFAGSNQGDQRGGVQNVDGEASETESVITVQEMKMSGENIWNVILREISRIGLDPGFCIG